MNWAYHVTDQQWRNQLASAEETLRQIEACKLAGIGKDVQEIRYSEPASGYLLSHPANAEKMGVTQYELACLADLEYVEIPGLPDAGNDWYAVGKAVQKRVDDRFGYVTHPSHAAKRRATALRHANKARKSLKARKSPGVA